MKLYFVECGTADNYIMADTGAGILCDNCAPDGTFAGVSLYSYDENDEKIPGEEIAAKIAAAIDPDICEDDLVWMGDPVLNNMGEWEAEQNASEQWQRDEAFLIGEY